MITLDGSFEAGGGQILRTALALSVLTQQSFEIENIRANKPESGLKAQHLAAVKAAQELCDAVVQGAELGSTKLIFEPKKISKFSLELNIGTAGSVTLLSQALLLPCFFAKKSINLKFIGGTDVQWSPQVTYFQEVFVPHIKKFCKKIDVKVVRRGYYPVGNGEMTIKIQPKYKPTDSSFIGLQQLLSDSRPIQLTEQGNLMMIKGVSHASSVLENAKIAESQARSAELYLKKKFSCPINIRLEYSQTACAGSGIVLWAVFSKNNDDIDAENPIILGSDVLSEKNLSADAVGLKCAEALAQAIASKRPLDDNLADQLVPWLALVKGSVISPKIMTPHLLSNIYVTEKFLGKCFDVDKENNIIYNIIKSSQSSQHC